MKNNPFQVSSPPIAAMRGRARETEKLLSHLQKEVPDHISVIGPRFIGKTVLLNALGSHFAPGNKGFDACLYWDIRHNIPASDEQFMGAFAAKLKTPIDRINPDAARLLSEDGSRFEAIKIVFETLQDDGKRVLVIMDGFDGVLLSTDITRNLWDNLRSLAELASIRFVTGSRRRLRELCVSPDSRTSDFWEIFYDTPLAIGPFSQDDFGKMLELFTQAGVSFEPGVQAELLNWCGGIPIATCYVCKRLWDSLTEGQRVTAAAINDCCTGSLEDGRDYWQGIWDDCSTDERDVLFEITRAGEIAETQDSRRRAAGLIQRGILRAAEKRITFSSKLLGRFAESAGVSSDALRRLFGNPEDFRRNAKPLAEARLAQLPPADQNLIELVTLATANLDKPHIVVNQVRGVINRALKLIWDSEVPDRRIPPDWTFHWQHAGLNNPPAGQISNDVGQQLRLLNLMTDDRKPAPTRIRRSTYLLLNALKGIGDFGQHLGNETPTAGFAIVNGLMLVEFVEQVTSDLNSAPA